MNNLIPFAVRRNTLYCPAIKHTGEFFIINVYRNYEFKNEDDALLKAIDLLEEMLKGI